MATLSKRGILLASGLVVVSTIYFAFVPTLLDGIGSEWFSVWVPGEGWAQTDMPAWIYLAVQYVLPFALSFFIVAAIGLATRAERAWWLMAAAMAVLVPVIGYGLWLLLLYGPCFFVKCEFP